MSIAKMKTMTFGEAVQARRVELGLTTKEFAEILGVPATTLIGWIKDNRQPTFRYQEIIERELGLDVDDYFAPHEKKKCMPGKARLQCGKCNEYWEPTGFGEYGRCGICTKYEPNRTTYRSDFCNEGVKG